MAAGGLAASDAMVSSDNVRANVLWFRLNLVLMWCCWLRAGLGFVYAPRGCAFRHTFRGAFCETRSAAAIGKAFWIQMILIVNLKKRGSRKKNTPSRA